MQKPKIVCVVGTRPDAIKTAPVVRELQKFKDHVETILVATGQHKEMLAQALSAFDLCAEYDLEIMQQGQTLAQVTTRALEGLDRLLEQLQPSMVMAQGDTTTTFCAGLAAFYRQIPFGHIEAGLRTDSIFNPFPEEFNRRAVSHFAAHHYAPTQWAADKLKSEGIEANKIFVTGNTGIDAVKYVAEHAGRSWYPEHTGRVVLLTTHRRENWGAPQEEIAKAALTITETFQDLLLVVPMHRNPAVRKTLTDTFGEHPRVRLIEPPEYADFVKLMEKSYLLLTDSGGVQEEAPAFGKPVLVLRETTERPEGITAGTAKLVGTNGHTIITEATKLLADASAYSAMAKAVSPYGDGGAAMRIRYQALKLLSIETPKESMWN